MNDCFLLVFNFIIIMEKISLLVGFILIFYDVYGSPYRGMFHVYVNYMPKHTHVRDYQYIFFMFISTKFYSFLQCIFIYFFIYFSQKIDTVDWVQHQCPPLKVLLILLIPMCPNKPRSPLFTRPCQRVLPWQHRDSQLDRLTRACQTP